MINLSAFEQEVWNFHVITNYPQEACALVVNDKVIVIDNTAEDPVAHFRIDPKYYMEYGDSIQAVLHSHCYDITKADGMDKRIPSEQDMRAQNNMGCWWGISTCDGEEVSEILWFGKDRGEEYEGREFIYNVNDCYELVRDWYRREKGIEMSCVPRKWDWFIDERHFDDLYEKEGFYEVPLEEIQEGDLVYFGISADFSNHIGVYLGNDTVLHHLSMRLSNTETLSRWKRQIIRVIRYKGKQ